MRPTDSDPGFLTIGPDGYVWATTAASAPGSRLTAYQIIKVRVDLGLTPYDLAADAFPTNLVNISKQLYFGLDQEVEISGSDVYRDSVASISTTGKVNVLFQVNELGSYGYFWLNALTTPDSRIWLYDFEGFVHSCSLDGKCTLAESPSPEEYVNNLHPDSFAYSPADNNVYVANGYLSTIYKFSSADKLIKHYFNGYIGSGYTALTYCAGKHLGDSGSRFRGEATVWGSDSDWPVRDDALPLPKASYIATALVCGPDHHLWYLRGAQVGEILSKI